LGKRGRDPLSGLASSRRPETPLSGDVVKSRLTYSVNNAPRYTMGGVIRSFGDSATGWLSRRERVSSVDPRIQRVALRKLRQLDAAVSLGDLRVPPGNRLEALKGDRAGQHSIRVNDQWRICFVWTDAGPEEVEIVDYH